MSLYNEDELITPSWLHEKFLLEILKKTNNNKNLKIVGLDISPASLKGDHYGSCMFRVKVDYLDGKQEASCSRSLIVKTLPEATGLKQEFLMESKAFETEIGMYTETLPMIEQILAKHGDYTKFSPKVVYSALKPVKMIIMEDLCVDGFTTIRGRPYTLEEIKSPILKLAKLHAVSYMLSKSENSELVTKYQDGVFSSDKVLEADVITKGIEKFIKLLEKHKGFEPYVMKFKNIEKELLQDCLKLYRSFQNGVKDEIYVLNHGDFHIKNLMYKFNENGEHEDVRLVDCQYSVFAPSNIDMIYAKYMLYDRKARRENSDELDYYYFENFLATLRKLNFTGDLPKYSQYKIANIKHRNFALYLVSTFLPLFLSALALKPEDMKDVASNALMEDDSYVLGFYDNPAFIDELKDLLPKYLITGYLD